MAFIQSKGYSLSKRVSQVRQPCLVAWGAQDKILKPSEAQRFASAIPHAQARCCLQGLEGDLTCSCKPWQAR